MSGGDGGWLRSTAARALIFAALLLSLGLGAAFIVINTPHGTRVASGEPMTDQQSIDQVMVAARQIVDAAGLQDVSGSSIFLSCTSLHDPPYQAAVYLNFRLPETNSIKRIRQIGAAMLANGWQEAPALGEHFGLKLTRDGVTSTFHENPDDPRFGAMRIYGECRNMSNHRDDNPAFTDVTRELS